MVHVACPFDMLEERYMDKVLRERLNLEIGLNGGILDRYRLQSFKKAARLLEGAGLKATVHAPFSDMSMGARDGRVLKAVRARLLRSVEIAGVFKAPSLVCHTGFDRRHYWNMEEAWLETALETVDILQQAAGDAGTRLMIENVFEADPRIHQRILSQFHEVGFCYDIGHHRVFSHTDQKGWLNGLGDRLAQLHLHDNRGRHDDHLTIGQGDLDFHGLFSWLQQSGKSPVFTLEAHDEASVIPSLKALGAFFDRYGVQGPVS